MASHHGVGAELWPRQPGRHRAWSEPCLRLSRTATSRNALIDRGCVRVILASDKEGAGSNPATPTYKTAGHMVSGDLRFAFRPCRCPVLGANRERAGLLAGRKPASSRSSSGTADTGDRAARWRSDSSQRP